MIGIDVGNSTVDLPTSIHLTKRYRCWQCYQCYQMLANQRTVYIYLLQVLADNVDDLQKKGHAVEAANLKYSKFNATQIDVKADLKKSLIKTYLR